LMRLTSVRPFKHHGHHVPVTQSSTPVGTHDEMWAEGGPVIDEFEKWRWYDEATEEWYECTE